MLSPDELNRIADLLGLVYIPELAQPCTALKASEICTELARLQKALRELAQQQIE